MRPGQARLASRTIPELPRRCKALRFQVSDAYRWLVVALGALVFMTNYIDKTVIGVVGPHLLESLKISKVELGAVFSAFAVTYTLLQPLLSWLTDVLGPRAMVAAMVGWYGLFTVGSGIGASSLGALTLMRALTGAGEAASMPAATSGVARWVPKERRALAQGIMHAATRARRGRSPFPRPWPASTRSASPGRSGYSASRR